MKFAEPVEWQKNQVKRRTIARSRSRSGREGETSAFEGAVTPPTYHQRLHKINWGGGERERMKCKPERNR